MSRPMRCSGVTRIWINSGEANWAIARLLRSETPRLSYKDSAKMGGRVKADATVIKSLKKRMPSVMAGKVLGWTAPKCWM